MPNRLHPEADHAELPKAQRVRWWVAAVLSGVIAAAFAVVPFTPVPDPALTSVLTWAVAQSAVLVTSIVLTLYYIGKARLERAAFHADRIDIQAFADERPEDGADRVRHSAAELTARFKYVLNNSRLYTPTPLPGVSGSYDFVQIVGNAGEAADGWWRVAARLVKLAQPPAAFRISGTIRPGGSGRPHRLILELIRMPRFAASPVLIEDDDWSRVLYKAANAIAALVLPRSKYGKSIHWASWRDSKIPFELFDAYQRANHLVEHRRYDEALFEYHRALRFDPSNVYIRLEIGSVLEQLDLHLDALASYDDVVTICARGHRELTKWWQVGPDVERQPRHVRRQQDVALFLARYRHALVLGLGDAVAGSWWVRLPKPVVDAGADARVRRRADLRVALAVRFHRYRAPHIDTVYQATHDELLDPTATELVRGHSPLESTHDDRAARLRAYLCALSQFEIERLVADYRRIRRWQWVRRRRLAAVLSANALHLCLVWIVLRRAMANVSAEAGAVPAPSPADLDARTKPLLHNVFSSGAWPPNADELATAVRLAGSGARHRRSWSECYNAACTYAVALLEVGPRGRPDAARPFRLSEEDRDKVANLAVDELYHATIASHSGRLAGRRAWLMDEDPDLCALREHERFRVFEMVTFSPERPAAVRPLRAHVWEQVSYVRQLVCDLARCRARFWQEQSTTDITAPDVTGWLQADRAAWQQLRDLAVSRQDWYTRHEVIVALRQWAAAGGRATVLTGYPTYSDRLLCAQYQAFRGVPPAEVDTVTKITEDYVSDCDERLDELVAELAPLLSATVPATPELPVGRHGLARRFAHRAQLWAALAAWFDDCTPGGPAAKARHAEFRRRVPAALA